MEIDDPLEAQLSQLRKDLEITVQGEGTKALANLGLSLTQLGVAGTAIWNLLTGVAQKRTFQRLLFVCQEMKRLLDGIEDVAKQKIDAGYLHSEEFQTLFSLMANALSATHQQQKLKALAAGLASSATVKFNDTDKNELFMRAVIDLTPAHLVLLESLRSRNSKRPVVLKAPEPEQQMVLQRLLGYGLIETYLERTPFRPDLAIERYQTADAARHVIREAINQLNEVPTQCFSINSLGEEFLTFISAKEGTQDAAVTV